MWLQVDVEPDVCRSRYVCGTMGRHRVPSVECNVVVLLLHELQCAVTQVMFMFVNGAGYSRAGSETGCVQMRKWIRYKEGHKEIGEMRRAVRLMELLQSDVWIANLTAVCCLQVEQARRRGCSGVSGSS